MENLSLNQKESTQQANIIENKDTKIVSKEIWKQTYKNKENGKLEIIEIDMNKMSNENIQKAFSKCQRRLIELTSKEMKWLELSIKIETIAEKRNIKLQEKVPLT